MNGSAPRCTTGALICRLTAEVLMSRDSAAPTKALRAGCRLAAGDRRAIAWIEFDDHRPLGRRETGAKAALPIWIAYMKEALKGTWTRYVEPPEGIVTVRIDPASGQLASASHDGAVFESFRKERVPSRLAERTVGAEPGDPDAGTVTEKLF